jgi:hypothetical protein
MKAISMDKCDSKAPVKAKPAATKIVEKKEDVTKYLNKMCTPKDIKNMMGKCLDKTNPKYCQNGEYHDSNCKGPSSIACCVVRANNDRKGSTSTSEKKSIVARRKTSNMRFKSRDFLTSIINLDDNDDNSVFESFIEISSLKKTIVPKALGLNVCDGVSDVWIPVDQKKGKDGEDLSQIYQGEQRAFINAKGVKTTRWVVKNMEDNLCVTNKDHKGGSITLENCDTEGTMLKELANMAEVGGLAGPGDVHNFGEWELKENGMLCRDGCRWCVLNVDGELEVGKCGLKRQSKNWFAKAEYDLHPDMAYFDARYVEGEMISPEKINQMPTMKEIKRCLLTKDDEYINDIFPQSERKITCNNLPNCIFDDMTATCNPSSDEPKNNEVEPQTVEMRHVVRNESGSSGSSGPGNMENDSSGSSGPGNMESGSSGSSGPGNEEESDSSGSSGPGNMESGSSGSSGPGNEESGSSGPENDERGSSAPAGTKCCYKNGIPPMLFKGKCPSKTNELPLAKCQNNSDDNGEVCCKSKNAKSPSLFDKKCPAGAAEYPIEKCKEKKVKKEKDVKPEPNGKQCCKAPGIAKPKIYNNCPPQMKAISMDKCDSKAPVKGKHAKKCRRRS